MPYFGEMEVSSKSPEDRVSESFILFQLHLLSVYKSLKPHHVVLVGVVNVSSKLAAIAYIALFTTYGV